MDFHSSFTHLPYTDAERAAAAVAQVAIAHRFGQDGFAAAASTYLRAHADEQIAMQVVPSVTSGEWGWTTVLRSLASDLSPARRDMLSLDVSMSSPWEPDEDAEDWDPALVTRRADVCLELLNASFSVDEAMRAVGAVAASLNDSSRSGVKKALQNPLIGDAAEALNDVSWFAIGVGSPISPSQLLSYGQEFLDDEDLPVAVELAIELAAAEVGAFWGDLEPARLIGRHLVEESQRLSSIVDADDRVRLTRLHTSALLRVDEILGDDDSLVDDAAPNYVGMRLGDVKKLATAQVVHLSIVDIARDEDSERSPMMESNWFVRDQDPKPGVELNKRRRVRIGIAKQGEQAIRSL